MNRNQTLVLFGTLVFIFTTIFPISNSFTGKSAHAQEEYFPEHPEVEQMVQRAVERLESAGSSSDTGEKVLIALAIVEANKRYYQQVPRDNPRVQEAIAAILHDIPDEDPTEDTAIDRSNLLKHDEIYQPCLAMILLAEVDDSKYAPQIKRLLKSIQDRQEPTGAFTYLRKKGTGDTSQTQYAALALFVAKHHGFNIDPEVGKRALNWLTVTQRNNGGWVYTVKQKSLVDPGQALAGAVPTLSIQAAGLGTVYLLADVLQLSKRRKNMGNTVSKDDIGLPKTVAVYIRPKDGEASVLNKVGPLAKFDTGRLNSSTRAGNNWLETNFDVAPNRWGYYYLYALERYAWFREQAEGDVGKGVLTNWYDKGVEYLKDQQRDTGGFINDGFQVEKTLIATSFAILFLVRSSEVLSQPASDSELVGGIGFPKDAELRVVKGEIVSSQAEKNLADMLELMKEDLSGEELANLTRSLKKAVVEFKNKDNKSRGEIKSFLRGMVSARNYFRRLIAVRFLAGEQDMNNVPALLYSLGDPDFRICLEAHDGLRLISRRIDSLVITEQTRKNAQRDPGVLTPEEKEALRAEFKSIKKKWTDWFLKIRPDAELLD